MAKNSFEQHIRFLNNVVNCVVMVSCEYRLDHIIGKHGIKLLSSVLIACSVPAGCIFSLFCG